MSKPITILVLALTLCACSDKALEITGERLHDAGDVLMQMGDAAAQPPTPALTVACDQSFTRQITTTSASATFVSTTTTYFALMEMPVGLENLSRITAYVCGRVDGEAYDQSCPEYAPDSGTACTESGRTPPVLDCSIATASFDAGQIYVPCGSTTTQETTRTDGVAVLGQRYSLHHMTAHVVVD